MQDELSKNLWSILRYASPADWEDGSAARRVLRELAEASECEGAALEVLGHGKDGDNSLREWQRVVEVGTTGKPTITKVEDSLSTTVRLVLWNAADGSGENAEPVEGGSGRKDAQGQAKKLTPNLGLALSVGAQLVDLAQRLKAKSFQDNYRLVTLEALYDVGLAIASTLNLDELTDGILLRAVSLLDARVGALYLLEEDQYRLEGTIGGEAEKFLAVDDPRLQTLESGDGATEDQLLPGTAHTLVVPIAVDGSPCGLLALGDKESRTGIGPFASGDRRALLLFANQAAIALENANLHRQALEKERLEREMELAAEIQRGILPATTPDLLGIELIGWNRPTRHVGGDYYGWLKLPSGHTGIVVADVTGKGMPAALLVNTLHSALDLLLDSVEPGVAMVERLNSHVVESSRSNKFITMILMTIDPECGAASFINAGHNPGVLVRADGSTTEMQASGLPLGLLPGSSYRLETFNLEPGDMVCLYSDGITECADPADEEFGMERLVPFLVERRTRPLAEVLEELDQAVTKFADGAPQHDDQTVVLVRRRPSA